MSILKDIYNIPEITAEEMQNSLNFKFTTAVKEQFTLNISELNEHIVNFNSIVIWNFGDPFSSSNEYTSTNLLDVVTHEYSYAGTYTINAVVLIQNYFYHITERIDVLGDYNRVYIDPSNAPDPFISGRKEMIRIYSVDANAKIYYTLDETDPLTSPTRILYTNGFELEQPTVVKYYSDFNNTTTDVYTEVYDINIEAPVLTFYPEATNHPEPIWVTIDYITQPEVDPNISWQIYYSINGGTVYSYNTPFLVSNNATVMAYYTKTVTGSEGVQNIDSVKTYKHYALDLVQPALTVSPSAGNYYNDMNITITCNKINCTIYYQLDDHGQKTYTSTFNLANEYEPGYFAEGTSTPVHLTATITDSFDRTAVSDIDYNFIIDHTPPVINLITTPPLSAEGTQFNFNFSFTVSELAAVGIQLLTNINGAGWEQFTVNGQPWAEPNKVYMYSTPPNATILGLNTIVFKAIDKAGNEGQQTYSWTVIS